MFDFKISHLIQCVTYYFFVLATFLSDFFSANIRFNLSELVNIGYLIVHDSFSFLHVDDMLA